MKIVSAKVIVCSPGRSFVTLDQVRTGCHGANDLSPVAMGAALHFDSWVPNFGIQEYMRTPRRQMPSSRMTTASRTAICCAVRHRAIGVDIDEEQVAKYPHKPAYLPVACLRDWTMRNR